MSARYSTARGAFVYKPIHIMEKRHRFLGGASKIQEDTASVVKNRCSVGCMLRADYFSAVVASS
ncbi:MAG: hypothetical protein ACK45R_07865 [Candidatus Kapaibacterium sp.]